jgi:hypothetical protein
LQTRILVSGAENNDASFMAETFPLCFVNTRGITRGIMIIIGKLIGEMYVDSFMEKQAILSMPTVTLECVEMN